MMTNRDTTKIATQETTQFATKISEASRQVEQTAVQVAQKQVDRAHLTNKVSDSAAALSNYILKRARIAS